MVDLSRASYIYCLFTGVSSKAVKGGGEAKSQLDELGDLFGSMNAGSASSNHAADVRQHYTWCMWINNRSMDHYT